MRRTVVFIFLSLFGFLSSQFAFAQRIVGSGGDIVECPDQPAQLMDFYIGGKFLGLFPRQGSASHLVYDQTTANFQEIASLLPIVEFWLSHLERLDPARSSLYTDYLQRFPNEWSLVQDEDFPNMPDEGEVDIGRCGAQQIAVQRRVQTQLEKRYLLSAEMWRRLPDPLQRAGLILHEIIYREALTRGHTSSYYVHQLAALIADTQALDRLSADSYQLTTRDLFFTAFRDTQEGSLIFAKTEWVYYQEPSLSADAADRACRTRLGPNAFAGFSSQGYKTLSHSTASSIVMQVHSQHRHLYFWNINSQGRPERWVFDGYFTLRANAASGPTELLCSYAP